MVRGAARPSEGRLPGLLQVPGYNMEPPVPKAWANKGYAAFSVAPRGKLRSNRQFNPGYPGLLTYSMVDRNTYSYRGFYMDACRGVEFLLSRDEVDGDRIGVTGHSQGGGLTVSTAALRPEIKAAAAGAPYLCGYMDAIELTDAYPYQEIADYLRMYPDSREQVENTLAYFDGINLAPTDHLSDHRQRGVAGQHLPAGDGVCDVRRHRQHGQAHVRLRRPRPRRQQPRARGDCGRLSGQVICGPDRF